MLVIMIRTLILYPLIILLMRLMGKKQLGELQPSELVTTILISNIATLSIEDPTVPMLLGIVPMLMIVCLDVFMSVLMLKSPKLRDLVAGHPKVVISDGVIDKRQLEELRYTIDDLLEAMREDGIFDISEVQYAIVETTGKIHFFQKPASAENEEPADPPSVVIKDGNIVEDGLERSGMTERTLEALLEGNEVTEKQVFLLTVSRGGDYTLIRKDGKSE